MASMILKSIMFIYILLLFIRQGNKINPFVAVSYLFFAYLLFLRSLCKMTRKIKKAILEPRKNFENAYMYDVHMYPSIPILFKNKTNSPVFFILFSTSVDILRPNRLNY